MNRDCLFCRLVNGASPRYQVYEDEQFLVLLPLHPINLGHVLVVTKEHIESFYDVEDALYIQMMLVKRMALAIKRVVDPLQVALETSGIENRHVHIHVLPVHGLYDRIPQEVIEYRAARPASVRELTEMARRLATQIDSL